MINKEDKLKALASIEDYLKCPEARARIEERKRGSWPVPLTSVETDQKEKTKPRE
jgi:hypothetical protein